MTEVGGDVGVEDAYLTAEGGVERFVALRGVEEEGSDDLGKLRSVIICAR